jgi:hypothetical protein
MITSLPKSYKGLLLLTYNKRRITSSEVQIVLLCYDQRDKKSEEGASDGQGMIVRNNHGGKSIKKKKGKPQCFNYKE